MKRLLVVLAVWGFWVCPNAYAVTIGFDLQATAIGDHVPIFGINALPAGPFSGSISLAGDTLLSSHAYGLGDVTGFNVTIGTQSWGLSDLTIVAIDTDVTGAIPLNGFYLTANVPNSNPLDKATFNISYGLYANISWFAGTFRPDGIISFSPPPGPLTLYGNAIGGDDIYESPGVVNLTVSPVPEPSTMLLLGSGLAGLVGYGRRRFRK